MKTRITLDNLPVRYMGGPKMLHIFILFFNCAENHLLC